MDWLAKLHLIEAPEGTTLRAAQMSLRGLLPLWLAGLVLAVGAGLFFYLYARENAPLGIVRRTFLALLRTGLLGLALVLLLRPVLLAEFQGERARAVVLLLDSTRSMQQQDRRLSAADRLRVAIARGVIPPGTPLEASLLTPYNSEKWQDPSRADLVRAVFGNRELKLIEALRRRGPVQAFLFDDGLRSPAESFDNESWLRSYKADGNQTALADAIHELLERSGGELPAAIVVCSDGRDNASKLTLDEAARACRDRGVPLHVYGVGSSEAGLLEIQDVGVPSTVFVDARADVKDDEVEVPVRFRCRGYRQGTLVVTLALGSQTVRREFPVRSGEELREVVRFVPAKGKEGPRDFRLALELKGAPDPRDEVRRVVQVKNNRVKVLYVENTPRREYRFIGPVLERDRRVLARFFLVEGDPRLAEEKVDPESGAMFLAKFPPNFPEPAAGDPDRRPYDLLVLGDVPAKALGAGGPRAVARFVKEGGGLVLIAGRFHAPGEYAGTLLAEVLPVEFTRQEFAPPGEERTRPFNPLLTYDGEQSPLLALADSQEDNLRLWKDELWENGRGFYWHYPVAGLRPGATALLVHPDKRVGKKPGDTPMPLIATHYYGKGEALFFGVDETWRWRDGAGDKRTARLWGQIVARLGLPHLLGNARRSQLDLERGAAVLGRPGTVKARLLDPKYDPLRRPQVQATLVRLDDAGGARRVLLKRVAGQPGEYRGSLPNDTPGRFELRLPASKGVEATALPYRVELPPRHELERAPLAEEALRAAAAVSGGRFYREEDLYRLADNVQPQKASFVVRQEVLLWNPLALALFVLLISAEWVVRKFSNLS
jgi:hypothetical protein